MGSPISVKAGIVASAILCLAMHAPTALASPGIAIFYLPEENEAWDDALSNWPNLWGYDRLDLDGLPDLGMQTFDGPLTADGNDVIPRGFMPWYGLIDSNINAHGDGGLNGRGVGGEGLLALGPSAGFGNPSNALLANHAEDSFDFSLGRRSLPAIDLTLTSIGGSGSVDLTVETWDWRGPNLTYRINDVPAPPEGRRIGIVVLPGKPYSEFLTRINLYDPSGGQEGIQGITDIYYNHPAPGALCTLAVAGVLFKRRRR